MILRSIVSFFVGLLPSVELPEATVDAFSEMSYWSSFVNYYIPIDTAVYCIAVFLGVSAVCVVLSALLQLL